MAAEEGVREIRNCGEVGQGDCTKNLQAFQNQRHSVTWTHARCTLHAN